MNRRNKLLLNSITALICEVVVLICGFVLPRYMLKYFGSEVNGLVNSITRFLSAISLLELGIGPVIQSNLYKPLAEKDDVAISKIVLSAQRFYRTIAYIFVVYVIVLALAFPTFTSEFDYIYTVLLVLIVSISTFVQYFFGITNQVLLNADQKIYVTTIIQIATVIVNTILSIVLIQFGCKVHVIKLVAVGVFVLRPLFLNYYVAKNYCIDKKNIFLAKDEEPIKQKWSGFAQHLTAVVTQEMDIILLTLFATYQMVSIYSTYFLVVNGIVVLVLKVVSGLDSFWGNMLAKREYELLNKTFVLAEVLVHAGVTFLFVATAILIAPFVSVYTNGIEDASAYWLPLFGMLLSFAYGAYCLRVPYFRIIKAAGHYKETQSGALISMLINIVISIVLVFTFQLIGVAIGTLAAMLYHTVYFAWYLRKNILNRPFRHFVKHIIIDVIVGVLGYVSTIRFAMNDTTYLAWIVYAVIVASIVGVITLVINLIAYNKEFTYLVKVVRKKV